MLSVSVVLSVYVETALHAWSVNCVSLSGAMRSTSFCTRRFVVDCGKPSVVAIFLLPRAAIVSIAKSSFSERTTVHAQFLKTLGIGRQMMLWCIDFVS